MPGATLLREAWGTLGSLLSQNSFLWGPSFVFTINYGASFTVETTSLEKDAENCVETGHGVCETWVRILAPSLGLSSLLCKMGR